MKNILAYRIRVGGAACMMAGAAAAALCAPVFGQSWEESAKLVADDAAPGAVFGHALSASGDAVVIGAYRDNDARGAAYVFRRVAGEWMQEAKLTARDAAADDYFGWSVAMDGDVAVVGAYGDDDDGSQSGSAYVFERTGGAWSQTAKLTADDAQVIDAFGISVFVLGDTIFVGAPFDDEATLDCGSVYVFERVGGVWTQTQKITAADADDQDRFGISVAATQDWLLVGAYFDDERGVDAGAAYVFRHEHGAWTQAAKLTGGDTSARDEFGYAVALDATTALIGARYHDAGVGDSGAVYVFENFGGAWTQTSELAAADASPFARMGAAVALSGDRALIGADRDDERGVEAGAAYVFDRTSGVWSQSAKLIGHDTTVGDQFGHAVALTPFGAMAGARQDDDWGMDSGSVFVFEPQLPCTGRETIRTATCASSSEGDALKVVLAHGTPGDAFLVRLSDGKQSSGALNARGKGKVKFRGVAGGDGSAAVQWGCGATDERDYACP